MLSITKPTTWSSVSFFYRPKTVTIELWSRVSGTSVHTKVPAQFGDEHCDIFEQITDPTTQRTIFTSESSSIFGLLVGRGQEFQNQGEQRSSLQKKPQAPECHKRSSVKGYVLTSTRDLFTRAPVDAVVDNFTWFFIGCGRKVSASLRKRPTQKPGFVTPTKPPVRRAACVSTSSANVKTAQPIENWNQLSLLQLDTRKTPQ